MANISNVRTEKKNYINLRINLSNFNTNITIYIDTYNGLFITGSSWLLQRSFLPCLQYRSNGPYTIVYKTDETILDFSQLYIWIILISFSHHKPNKVFSYINIWRVESCLVFHWSLLRCKRLKTEFKQRVETWTHIYFHAGLFTFQRTYWQLEKYYV